MARSVEEVTRTLKAKREVVEAKAKLFIAEQNARGLEEVQREVQSSRREKVQRLKEQAKAKEQASKEGGFERVPVNTTNPTAGLPNLDIAAAGPEGAVGGQAVQAGRSGSEVPQQVQGFDVPATISSTTTDRFTRPREVSPGITLPFTSSNRRTTTRDNALTAGQGAQLQQQQQQFAAKQQMAQQIEQRAIAESFTNIFTALKNEGVEGAGRIAALMSSGDFVEGGKLLEQAGPSATLKLNEARLELIGLQGDRTRAEAQNAQLDMAIKIQALNSAPMSQVLGMRMGGSGGGQTGTRGSGGGGDLRQNVAQLFDDEGNYKPSQGALSQQIAADLMDQGMVFFVKPKGKFSIFGNTTSGSLPIDQVVGLMQSGALGDEDAKKTLVEDLELFDDEENPIYLSNPSHPNAAVSRGLLNLMRMQQTPGLGDYAPQSATSEAAQVVTQEMNEAGVLPLPSSGLPSSSIPLENPLGRALLNAPGAGAKKFREVIENVRNSPLARGVQSTR